MNEITTATFIRNSDTRLTNLFASHITRDIYCGRKLSFFHKVAETSNAFRTGIVLGVSKDYTFVAMRVSDHNGNDSYFLVPTDDLYTPSFELVH